MGKLIGILILGLLSQFAFAQEVNLIVNPNFESRTSRWLKTGSSTFSIESASPIEGSYSAIWNASATGEFFRSSTYTIPVGLRGVSCQAQMRYLWNTGTSGHIIMNVDDGTDNIAQLSLEPTSGSVPRTAQISFTCPTSGTLRFELESTANADAITLDQVFIGGGRNQLQISQAEATFNGYYPPTSGCNGSFNSTSLADVTGNGACPAITVVQSAQTPNTADNDNAWFLGFPSLKPGIYRVTVRGQFSNSSVNANAVMRLRDSTGQFGTPQYRQDAANGIEQAFDIQGTFVYSTTQTGVSFLLQGAEDGSGAVTLLNDLGGVAAQRSTQWTVERFPLGSADALTLETTGWFFDGNIGGDIVDLTTGNVATYATMTNASLDLVLNPGSVTGRIACNANPSTGLTCAVGSEEVGVSVEIPQVGLYEACFSFSHHANVSGPSGDVATTFQVVRTADISAGIVEEGKSRTTHNVFDNTGNMLSRVPVRSCGTFNITSAGRHAFRLYYEQQVAGTVNSSGVYADRNAAQGQQDVHITIRPLTQQLPAPVFTDVKQKMNAAFSDMYSFAALVAYNGGVPGSTGTIQQGGTWLASFTDNGVGDTTATFTSPFVVAPSCICTVENAAAQRLCVVKSTTTTTVRTLTTNVDGTTVGDEPYHLICMGTR